MANAPRNRRRTQNSRSSRTRQGDNRQRRQRTSPAQGGTARSRRGTLTRPDTGYTLHSGRVRRESGNGMSALLNPRILILVGIVIVVLIVLFTGISSCVRKGSSSAESASTEDTAPKNEQDSRVAAGVSATMTSQFTEALDRGEQLAEIAKNADKYDDERLLQLALREPEAVAFVASYPTSDKSSKPYEGSVKRGKVPLLYDWDSHWGAVTYGEGPLAVTGSGPTTLAMAYMGLTGKTDNSPTEIAQQASKSNYTDNESGSKNELFSKLATSLGLQAESLEMSADTILYTLSDNTVIVAKVKAETLTSEEHWVLIVNVNNDGSLTVYDPTSSAVSATYNTWSPGTLADASDSMFSLTLNEKALSELESSTNSSTSSDRNSTTSSSEDEEDADASTSSSKDSSSSSSSD